MSTERPNFVHRVSNGKWAVAGFCVVMAIVLVVVSLVNDNTGAAVSFGVVLVAYAGLLLFLSGRSETVALLANRDMDERRRHIDEFASTVTTRVISVVLVTGFVVQLVRGVDTSPWLQLCSAFGFVYMLALAWGRRRI
ncbi:MAG: DUF2178 domain-containing protein [Acidothermaceae bacterium]